MDREPVHIYSLTGKSYRQAARLINRIRHREKDGTPNRKLQKSTEKGKAWSCSINIYDLANGILAANESTKLERVRTLRDETGKDKPAVLENDKALESAKKFRNFRNAGALLNIPVAFESQEENEFGPFAKIRFKLVLHNQL